MKLGELNPSSATAGQRKAKVLIVDDDSVNRRMLRQQAHVLGYDSMEASNGREAMDILLSNPSAFNAVVLDRDMPEMNGMDVAHQMSRNPAFSSVPIIMQVAQGADHEVHEGLDAGVFYYISKPIDPDLLSSVLRSAVHESNKVRSLRDESGHEKSGYNLMQTASFTFRTMEEAESLACFIARCFPEPERVISGLAELMLNAIEHGNLGIGYDMKAALCRDGRWREEIDQRLRHPGYFERMAEVTLTRKDGGIYIVVTDQGDGFDWKSFLKINPTRAGDAHGRGIAMANSISFDKLTYNDKGNKAVAYVADTSSLEW